MEQIAAEVRRCTRCRLAQTRTHAVPGEGDPQAALFLVGEAPGRTEDETGRPFQGMAGRFLNTALEQVATDRAAVFISSVNKCRPPRNRTPRTDEVMACAPYLERQLALVGPAVVLAMGTAAAKRLLPEAPRAPKVSQLRGQIFPVAPDRALIVTFHPAAAMRFPAHRQPFLDDLERAVALARRA